MRSFQAALFLALSASLVGASCGVAENGPEPHDLEVGQAESPIINGVLDTTHAAVVAVFGNNFSCSGTILQVANGQGYVLTAAHCCVPGNLPNLVVIGNDYNSGQQFAVVPGSPIADSCYTSCAGSTDDVCMLRFSGANASTPTIAPMTPATDAMQVGTPVTYVGYGLTSSPPAPNNTKRRSVDKTIGSLSTYFVEYANPSVSGTCEGDSGGPGLVTVNGQLLVSSVTSFGDQACTQLGTSIRTSSVYTKFIAPYLQDQAPISGSCPLETDCNVCISNSTNPTCGGDCTNTLGACQNDAECSALLDCYNGCTTAACQTACSTQHIGALQQYQGIVSCICGTPCQAACGTNGFCTGLHCGIKPPAASADCGSCTEKNCCAEAFACSTDTNCKKCFTAATPAAACAENAAALAYYQCVTTSCSGSCTLHNPAMPSTTATTGAGAGGESATGGAGGAAAVTSAVSTTSTASGSDQPTTTTGCACRTSSSDARWPSSIVAVVALAGAWVRRRSAKRSNTFDIS